MNVLVVLRNGLHLTDIPKIKDGIINTVIRNLNRYEKNFRTIPYKYYLL